MFRKTIFFLLFATSCYAGTHVQTTSTSAIDNSIVRMDGTSGQIIQKSTAVVDDNGNVGIGTNIPQSVLEINGGNGSFSGPDILTIWGDPNHVSYLPFLNITNLAVVSMSGSLSVGGGNISIPAGGVVAAAGFTSTNGNLSLQGTTSGALVGTGGYCLNNTVNSCLVPSSAGSSDFLFNVNSVTKVKITDVGNVGIGTSSPQSALTLGSNGHFGSTGTAPTVASNDCGSTSQGTIVAGSTDLRGQVTAGTLAVTSCAVTFTTAFGKAPICFTQDDTTLIAVRNSQTTTKLTIVSTTSMSGDVVSWFCLE